MFEGQVDLKKIHQPLVHVVVEIDSVRFGHLNQSFGLNIMYMNAITLYLIMEVVDFFNILTEKSGYEEIYGHLVLNKKINRRIYPLFCLKKPESLTSLSILMNLITFFVPNL